MALQIDNIETSAGSIGAWQPTTVNISDGSSSGVNLYLNDSGAGKYYAFPNNSDSLMAFNYALNNQLTYDGSDLKITLRVRTSISGTSGKTVALLLKYAFIKDGDDSATEITNVAQQNVDVSSNVQNITFSIDLGTMTGELNAHTLLFTIERNGSGASSDNFLGNLELIGIKIFKV